MSITVTILWAALGLILTKLLIFLMGLGKGNESLKEVPGPGLKETVSKFWSFRNEIQNLFCHWADKFGPFYRVSLAGKDVLVLNSPKLIKEAFSKDELSSAYDYIVLQEFARGKYGLCSAGYKEWSELRKFLHRFQRPFSFQNEGPQKMLLEQLSEFTASFSDDVNRPILMEKRFLNPTINSIWVLITGQKLCVDHKENDWAVQFMHLLNAVISNPAIAFFAGIVKSFPWLLKSWNDYTKILPKVWFYIDKVVEDHVTGQKANEEKIFENIQSMDFIDAFLSEIKNSENNPNSVFNGEEGFKHLKATLIALLIAAGDTVSCGINWAFLRLALNPECQQKIWQEIEENVGKSRPPTLQDRKKMLYVQAFILETLRVHPIVPFLAHRCSHDFIFEGKKIPAGTFVVANLHQSLQDPTLWKNPKDFDPDRFILKENNGNADGIILHHEGFIPFSAGQRKCPGNKNALDLLFLYLTHMIQKFEVKLDPSSFGKIDLEPVYSWVLAAKPHNIILEVRK